MIKHNINAKDFSDDETEVRNSEDFVDAQKQSNSALNFSDYFGQSENKAAIQQNTDVSKLLFRYNVPLSIQRNVNAQLVIKGELLKKRDLEVLTRKVEDLIDAFEDESDEGQINVPAQGNFDFRQSE